MHQRSKKVEQEKEKLLNKLLVIVSGEIEAGTEVTELMRRTRPQKHKMGVCGFGEHSFLLAHRERRNKFGRH